MWGMNNTPFSPSCSCRITDRISLNLNSSETLREPETDTGLVETFIPVFGSDQVTNAGHILYSCDRAKLC